MKRSPSGVALEPITTTLDKVGPSSMCLPQVREDYGSCALAAGERGDERREEVTGMGWPRRDGRIASCLSVPCLF